MPLTIPRLDQLKPGTQLRHYKGGLYVIIGLCRIEATLETGVLYQPQQGDAKDIIWMRPIREFQDTVTTSDGVVPRFTVVEAKTEI